VVKKLIPYFHILYGAKLHQTNGWKSQTINSVEQKETWKCGKSQTFGMNCLLEFLQAEISTRGCCSSAISFSSYLNRVEQQQPVYCRRRDTCRDDCVTCHTVAGVCMCSRAKETHTHTNRQPDRSARRACQN
jgi:hypothetical protein